MKYGVHGIFDIIFSNTMKHTPHKEAVASAPFTVCTADQPCRQSSLCRGMQTHSTQYMKAFNWGQHRLGSLRAPLTTACLHKEKPPHSMQRLLASASKQPVPQHPA